MTPAQLRALFLQALPWIIGGGAVLLLAAWGLISLAAIALRWR